MVRFEEKKLIIEIDTYCPAEAWQDLHRGICDIVRGLTADDITNDSFFAVVDFLKDLMPDYDMSKLMIKK